MSRKTILHVLMPMLLILALLWAVSGIASAQAEVMREGSSTSRGATVSKAAPKPLKRGNSGPEVRQLQQKLIEYGYPSPENGKFDANTVTAVRYFQAANRFKANGVATSAMRQFLNTSTNVVRYETFEASEMLASCKKGMSGLRVTQVQKRLKELGYYKGKVNGLFSETLRKAVVKFKQFNNISPANGNVTKQNRVQMNSESALSYSQVEGPDTIKPGAKGTKVLRLQVVMKDMSYYKGGLDGKYGSSLVKAVKTFQKAKKLYPSGVAYSTTMALLQDKMSVVDGSVDLRAYAVIEKAKDQLAKKYKNRAAGPSAFDCSGLTRYVFKKAVGISLAESATAQAKRGTLIVNREDVKPGDLLFFATGSNKAKLNHVGICIAVSGTNLRFIHASSEKKKVIASETKDESNGNFYGERFLFARRMW